MEKNKKKFIRDLRKNSTDAEKHLWYFLRAKRLNGIKFRRQHLIHPYVVDFICVEKKIIIELDGGQHLEQKNYDQKRNLFLESKGYKILRFWNDAVFKEIDSVLNVILVALNK